MTGSDSTETSDFSSSLSRNVGRTTSPNSSTPVWLFGVDMLRNPSVQSTGCSHRLVQRTVESTLSVSFSEVKSWQKGKLPICTMRKWMRPRMDLTRSNIFSEIRSPRPSVQLFLIDQYVFRLDGTMHLENIVLRNPIARSFPLS